MAAKPNVWDKAKKLKLCRMSDLGRIEKLDRGVNYFVLMLEQLGLVTHFSCQGHPDGFYITFSGSYEMAQRVHDCGFFTVEIERENYWSLRISSGSSDEIRSQKLYTSHRRWAAEAWEKRLGPLDFERIKLGPALEAKGVS